MRDYLITVRWIAFESSHCVTASNESSADVGFMAKVSSRGGEQLHFQCHWRLKNSKTNANRKLGPVEIPVYTQVVRHIDRYARTLLLSKCFDPRDVWRYRRPLEKRGSSCYLGYLARIDRRTQIRFLFRPRLPIYRRFMSSPVLNYSPIMPYPVRDSEK